MYKLTVLICVLIGSTIAILNYINSKEQKPKRRSDRASKPIRLRYIQEKYLNAYNFRAAKEKTKQGFIR